MQIYADKFNFHELVEALRHVGIVMNNHYWIYISIFFIMTEFFKYKTIDKTMRESWLISIVFWALNSITILVCGTLGVFLGRLVDFGFDSKNLFDNEIILFFYFLIVMDLIVFFYHWLHHKKFLWRFHLIHHVEPRPSSFSAFRFHPIENSIFPFYNFFVGTIMKVPVSFSISITVAVYFLSLYVHSRLYLPVKIESIISKVFVTPRYHHVHHEKYLDRSYNFGLFLTIWDRLIGTYLPFEEVKHECYGVKEVEEKDANDLRKNLFSRL